MESEKKNKNGTVVILEEIIAKHFPELLKEVNSQILKYITLNAYIREEERLKTEQIFILSQKKHNKIKKTRGKKE